MFVVVADDEYRFRKTVVQWIATQFGLTDAVRDEAIDQIGCADSDSDFLIIPVSTQMRFLVVGQLDGLWQLIQSQSAASDRILVLLDLGWGDQDALAELQRLRSEAELRHFPVIIYSKSDAESDIKRSYQATANAYMVKKGSMRVRREHFFRAIDQWAGTSGDYRPPYVSYAA